jgi:hypothetical protein
MKLTTEQLRQIIKEELDNIYKVREPALHGLEPGCDKEFERCYKEKASDDASSFAAADCYDEALACNREKRDKRIMSKYDSMLHSNIKRHFGDRFYNHLKVFLEALQDANILQPFYDKSFQSIHRNNSSVQKKKKQYEKAYNIAKNNFGNVKKYLGIYKEKVTDDVTLITRTPRFKTMLSRIEQAFPLVKKVELRNGHLFINKEENANWYESWKIKK